MKNSFLVLISIVLTMSLILAIPGKVQAFDWTAPVVTLVFGDSVFTATPTPVSKLPGIIPNDNGLILPLGFPQGTAQFGGDAVVVKDLTRGSIANVCFSMPPKRTEWEGSIFQWNGTKWAKLATTINQGDVESSAATACAEIYGDGTYALIMGYTGKPEVKVLPVCSEKMDGFGGSFYVLAPDPARTYMPDKYLTRIITLVVTSNRGLGTPVTYQILNFAPAGSIGGATTATGSVVYLNSGLNTLSFFTDPLFQVDSTQWIYGDVFLLNQSFTLRLTFPDCYVDISNPFAIR